MKLHFKELQKISRQSNLPEGGTHYGEVHLWLHTIHYDDEFLKEAPYLLSNEEMLKASKYHFEKDRRVYESGHVFIRKILSHYTLLKPSELDLGPVVNQKPILHDAPFDIYFNISHSGNKILVAVGFDTDVGVDVEKVVQDFDMDGFAEANYHPNELANFKKQDPAGETDYFYRIWTRKEAWLKLTGEGINDKLRELDFSGIEIQVPLKSEGHRDLYMISWKEAPDYIATVATFLTQEKLKFYEASLLFTNNNEIFPETDAEDVD